MNLPRLNRDYIPAIGLGVTQIMGYGTLMYAYAVLLPEMAKDLGLTLSDVFGILSLGLFFGGLVSPIAGKLVDHCGGRWVMTLGSIVASLALIAMSQIEGRIGLFVLILVAEGAGMFVLYNVAFASVARLDLGVLPQRSISVITLFGGVASTIFWPLTLALFNRYGWETTWVILGFSALLICTPIHFFVLRGPEREADSPKPDNAPDWPELTGHLRKQAMLWMVVSFIFSGYLMGAVMTLWVTNVQDLGHTAAMAAFAGAVIGPFKTVGRFFEMMVSRSMYPLVTYALSLGLMFSGFVVLLIFGFTLTGLLVYVNWTSACGRTLRNGRRDQNHRARYPAFGAIRCQRLRRTTGVDLLRANGDQRLRPFCFCMDHTNLRRLVVFCCHGPVSLLCHRYLYVYSRPKDPQT